MMRPRLSLLVLLARTFCSAHGWGAAAAATAPAPLLQDYSGAAAGLFNNMRTPAALIGGAIIPLGILTAPKIEEEDSSQVKLWKKANLLLALASLLSQIVAITYSTVAINKLAEIETEPTAGVAGLISKYYELPWVGTNIHFLFGLFGFGLLAIAKPYFLYGKNTGDVAACWTTAAMMFCVSIVNKGIAMGHGDVQDSSTRLAANLFGLLLVYAKLILGHARNGALPMASIGLLLCSLIPVKRMVSNVFEEEPKRD